MEKGTVMRGFIACTVALGVVLGYAGAADAAGAKKKKRYYSDYPSSSSQRARSESYDRARANAYDPTGTYRDMPDWARYALSPKGNR